MRMSRLLWIGLLAVLSQPALAQQELKFGHVGEPGSLFDVSATEFAKRAKLKFDYENWQEEVAQYRKDIGGDTLKDTDEWIFLTRIISAGNELQEFFQVLSSTTAPSQEAVQAARDSFPVKLER